MTIKKLISKGTILLIEDDLELSWLLRDFLVSQKYSVVCAHRVSEAVHKIKNQRFNCIVTDLHLDSGSALKIVDLVRNKIAAESNNFETPIILISGHLDKDVILSTANKVQSLMVKPINYNSLILKINELIAA